MADPLAEAFAVIEALPAAPLPPTDGGGAFPTSPNQTAGLTVRDYFAAHAPFPAPGVLYSVKAEALPAVLETLAWSAYAYADAMLRARGK